MVFVECRIEGSESREGVIIKCPPKGLFHDACDVILTSGTGVGEMVDDNDIVQTISFDHRSNH